MKIAVTYDQDGTVFQHFGRTEAFKVYTVEDGAVIASEILGSGGTGHEALAGLLGEHGIDVIICGGMGAGAQAALAEEGIEICSGATGDADAAVEAYLKGELVSTGVNCDHHHEDEEDGCGSHCGGGCGGCGGHCGGGAPIIEGKNAGKSCRVHYKGTLNDGTVFDSSYDRGEPIEFVCGIGRMIPGFDKAVADMEIGEIRNIHLMPEEAYGAIDPNAIFTVEMAQLKDSETLSVGQSVYLYSQTGQPIPVTVIGKDETTITFDANPPMAGKELNFTVELVDVL